MNLVTFTAKQSRCALVALIFSLVSYVGFGATNQPVIPDETESLMLLVKTLDATDDVAIQSSLLRGMLSGLEGRRYVPPPEGWSKLSKKLASSSEPTVRAMATQLSQIFGDRTAMQKSFRLLQDQTADLNTRRTALRSLLAQQNAEASTYLETLLDEPDLQLEAIRGFAMVENPTAPALLLQRYERLKPEHQRAVVETLATRKRYAQALLAAIKQNTISRDDIPVHVARSLNQILGERFVKVYGEIKTIGADREKQMAKYKKLVTPAALANADVSRGRAVYEKTCASCHLLYGEGGKIGPDLTGSNRANLDYILLNSVDPSYDVPEGYKMVLIMTTDGRVVSGVIAEEDSARIVLKTVEQPRLVIAKEDIESRKVSEKSMMPDGQLEEMKPQEVIDLIKYLRTTEQVELPK